MKILISILQFLSNLAPPNRKRPKTSRNNKIEEVAVPKDNYPLF